MSLQSFLASGSPASIALQGVLNQLHPRGWPIGLFGGASRDILLHGAEASPRDLDLVVDCQSRYDLKKVLAPFAPKLNGFSGFSFKLGGIPFDVWALKDTWAFRQPEGEGGLDIQEPTLVDLLHTTFFNIEKVVIELPQGIVHDGGFRQAFQDRVLELNYPFNPVPILCLVRTAVFARKFGMRLGPRLEDWILQHHLEVKEGRIERMQEVYYGRQVLTREEVQRVIDVACEAARSRQRATIP